MPMSAEHKAALAQGRRESRAIKAYLQALEARKPGRPVTAESLGKRISDLDAKIRAESDPLRRVELRQQRLDAQQALKRLSEAPDASQLEKDFVKNAKGYSHRKGISYSAWREAGVPAEVLKRAGVARTRRV